MKKYRAVRLSGEGVWRIEEWDREFPMMSSILDGFFLDKESAELHIKYDLLKQIDLGEKGEWFDGSVS